jgi:hypothetical protein
MGRKRAEKITEYIKERILSTYAVTGNMSETARQCRTSVMNVSRVVRRNRDDYNEIREAKKAEYAEIVWGQLRETLELGGKIIKEGLSGERDVPLNHVSSYFNVLYDKQALMVGDNTQNIGGDGIQVVLNMPEVVEDEEEWNKQEPSD